MASFLKDILGGGSNPAQKPLSGDDAGMHTNIRTTTMPGGFQLTYPT
jgi:hypothetical protein